MTNYYQFSEAVMKFQSIEDSAIQEGYGFTHALYLTMIGHGDQKFNDHLKAIWEKHPYVLHTIDSVRMIRKQLLFVSMLGEYLKGRNTIYDMSILFPNYDKVVYDIQCNHHIIEQAVMPTECCEIYKGKDYTVWLPVLMPDIMMLMNPAMELFQTAVDLKINLKIVHEIIILLRKLSLETTMCDLMDKGGFIWEELDQDTKQQ